MHIGFDISQTGSNKAGCGYFAHAMIQSLLDISKHKYSLYPSFGDFYFDALMPIKSIYSGQNVNYGPRHISKEQARKFWDKIEIETLLGNPNIVHANNFWCPIQFNSTRIIYTFYDMGFVIDPSWTTEANRIGCFNGVFRSAIAADWIVAISEASKKHYLNIFPHFSEKHIKVIYPCSRFFDHNIKEQRPKALRKIDKDKFWLNVGTIEPRKNQKTLIEAYLQYLNLGGKQYPLVLAGGKGWLMEDFKQYIEKLGIEDKILIIGYVSDKELIWLYRNCYANLYPSLFEGFGLPVLEGMQFGAATLASETSSIPEITEDSAILIKPKEIDEWAENMFLLSQYPEKRNKLRETAKKQAAKFKWRKSAEALLELYEEAEASPKRAELK